MAQTDKESITENNSEIREVYAEKSVTAPPEHTEEELRALALAYAKYLNKQELKPGDATFVEPEELLEAEPIQEETPEPLAEEAEQEQEEPEVETPEEAALRKLTEQLEKSSGHGIPGLVDIFDNAQGKVCEAFASAGKDFLRAGHSITSTYRQSRRIIGLAVLLIGVFAAVVLAIFDKYTVYEYAYNGKILGYVKNQEDVIDVLDVAGSKMTENNQGGAEITFAANQNVTFNLVDARGKSIDDTDIAMNKLVYMTDIETEAFGVYDGDNLVAVVKSEDEAERLLNQSMEILSEPDDGMELVSAEFKNSLDIKPVDVLLTSIQSYQDALDKMTNGGESEIYHIAEANENLGRIARTFGVDPINIYDENNQNIVTKIEQGDKICIRKIIDPVSVKMVETGKMKEIIEYETIKKNSDDYYEGDTHIEQEGINGVQIFEGTLTKVGGEVTKRKVDNIDVRQEKQDKIILVGTAERPKTAPTGTYAMPIYNYVITSNFGFRWGRLHKGVDLAAPTGTPIYATDGGTVVKSEYAYGYGNVVFIQHEDGRETHYAHCSQLLCNVGDKVYQGQLIALVGNTGNSFGSHLHFEIFLNGTPVNPRPYLGI